LPRSAAGVHGPRQGGILNVKQRGRQGQLSRLLPDDPSQTRYFLRGNITLEQKDIAGFRGGIDTDRYQSISVAPDRQLRAGECPVGSESEGTTVSQMAPAGRWDQKVLAEKPEEGRKLSCLWRDGVGRDGVRPRPCELIGDAEGTV